MKALAKAIRATIGRLDLRNTTLMFAKPCLVRGLFLAISVTTMLTARSPEQLVGLKDWAPEARMKLVGIAPMAGRTYVAIADAFMEPDKRQWLAVGGYLAGCYVKEIVADAAVLTERQTRREFRLHLTGPKEGVAAERRKSWINSEENPMCRAPFRLPDEVVVGWTKLSDEEKARVVSVCRDFGWNLVVTESSAGGLHFGWKSMYAGERKAAMAQARLDFEASLNPAQRAIYAKIKATFPAARAGGNAGESREQIEADSQVRGSEWPKLRATLSPGQRELDEAAMNPWKAMRRMP